MFPERGRDNGIHNQLYDFASVARSYNKEITCNRDTRNKSLAICSYNEIREPSEIENGIFYIGACQEKNQLENQFLHIIKI